MTRKPVVLLFSDDSTLIFACRMRDALLRHDPDCLFQMVWFSDENALSYRQLRQHLPSGPDQIVNGIELGKLLESDDISAVIVSRVYRPITLRVKNPAYRWSGGRPCVIAFLGGLDFFEANGFARRIHCDGVFVFPHSSISRFEKQSQKLDAGWQHVDFGHPSVIRPAALPASALAERSDIYFFTQAISPLTRRSRLHTLRVMAAIARANPDRTVYIKLRHLPDENQTHLHKEQFDYPSLMTSLEDVPANLKLTDISMVEALETAAIGITCTSTAALDVVGAGLPCMIYLDYVDHYRDRLAPQMRKLFKDSNLITPLEQILRLEPNTPNPDWVNDMFCPDDLGARVYAAIDGFEARPVQIPRNPADDPKKS